MKISLSQFASSETGVQIHTVRGKKYGTDAFQKSVFATLVGQEPGDSISELVIHRGTGKHQVELGDLEESMKNQILALLSLT